MSLLPASLMAQECGFKIGQDDGLRLALRDFHEVMAELVHGPAAQGDLAAGRSRADELSRRRDQLIASNLPEHLAPRCAEISTKVDILSTAVDDFVQADGSESMQVALDQMHTAYRELNHSLTTLSSLLEAFHDILHPLWHEAYPERNVQAIKAQIPKLKVRSKLILSTARSREPSKIPVAETLLESVTMLEEAAAADDDLALLESLRVVHDAYEVFPRK
jgi:hypothetical protein